MMRLISCNAREGNPHMQTHLVKSIKRDILRQRQTLQNSLASTLSQEIRKYKAVDEHFDTKRQAMVRAVDSTKRILGDKEAYFTQRGFVAMDMTYSKILHTLEEFERTWANQVEELKVQDQRMVSDVKVLECHMKARNNDFLFFKNLYN